MTDPASNRGQRIMNAGRTSLHRAKVRRAVRLALLFALAFLPAALLGTSAAAATPTFKQARANEISSGTVNDVAFRSPNTSGGLIVAFVLWDNTAPVTLSDTRGNTYLAATERTTWLGGVSAQLFYAKNIAGGANTVRATFATPIQSWAIVQAHEYAGLDRLAPLDGASIRTGSGTTMTGGPVSTTEPNALLFAGGGSQGTMNSNPTGYTARLNTSGNRTSDTIAPTTGTHTATARHTGGGWVMVLAGFKADTGADATPPTTPSGLAATANSPSEIGLSWSPSTDNVAVTGYQLERCTGAGCTSFTVLTTVTAAGHTDTGLTAGTTYRYRVRATDAAGNLSDYSGIATATTAAIPDTTAPSTPAGLTGTSNSISRIDLSWQASSDDVGVVGYRVFRDGVAVGTTATTSFQDNGVAVGTSYSYAVSAYDAAGNESARSAPVSVRTQDDSTAPSVPADLAVQVVSSTQTTLSWSTSTDDVGVAGYRIYRDDAFLKSSSVTPVQDAGLTPGTTYRYAVSAYDAAGNESARTAPIEITTPAPDNTPPSAAMTAPVSGSTVSGTVTVSANASDNVGVAEVDFLLDGVSIGVDTTSPYTVSWDTKTTTNGPHQLSARARDTAGNYGVTSGVVTVTVDNPATPPLPIGLVAGWNFNEGTGTTAADVTGNGNTATLNDTPLWTAGRYGGGITLDGSGDFLSVANAPTLNLSGSAMTFSGWVKPASGGTGDQVLFAKFYNGTMTAPYYQYGIELGGGVSPNFYIGTSAGLQAASMGSSLPLNEWTHLAVSFDGSQARFYLNGDLAASRALTATITPRDTPLHLGADIRPSQFVNGTLDDARVYNRALGQTEVRSDRDTPLRAPEIDPSAPTVTITAPQNNAQVSGIVTITAAAEDDTGIAAVQFFVDGVAVGPEDTVGPYGANWDTRPMTNGAHTVTARARDTVGNVTVADPITVNVVNSDHFQNEILATGLELPTAMKFLPDGRMLVSELQGRIRMLPPPYTTPVPAPFLLITNIGSSGVQQGIFDFALDPEFASNRYFYVFYTAGSPHEDRLSRFTANSDATGTVPGSELILYRDPQGTSPEHHGGAINFANDGKILFTTGEHFDPPAAQDLSTPRGKVHRINRDGSVPIDNPFYDGAGPNWDSIWAYGLRNPFRAYYDSPTGRLFIGDVGGNDHTTSNEEINIGVAGADYGWPNYEGQCPPPCTSPLHDWEHNGRDSSVTGGFVYRGSQFPSSMRGDYFFADYAQNWIRRLTLDENGKVTGVFNFEPASDLVDGPTGDIVYLTEGPDGALYYVDLGYSDTTGTFGISKIRRIRYLQSNQGPIAVAAANPTSGAVPLNVSFSSAGSSDPEGEPLTYSWDFGDGTVSSNANPTHTYDQAGQYTARLTVSDGVNSTFSTPILIAAGSPPAATISTPADGRTFRAGDVIAFSGGGTDPDDGPLPASAMRWQIDFLHDGHVHPGQIFDGVTSGGFPIPASGHDFSGNTRYRISLTVTDSSGLTDTTSVTVLPQKVDLSFATAPSGLTLHLDGIAKTTPFTYDTLAGFTHTVEARDQSGAGTAYTFASWSDGGARSHQITVPSTAQSYTATYTASAQNPGPVAMWGFDDGGGTTASDSSGNGNTATLVNGLTWAAGKNGTAVNLDGTNDYLTVPNSSSINVSGNALALSMWIKPGSVSGDSVVFGKFWNTTMSSPYYQYGIELAGGRPTLYIGTSGGLKGAGMDAALPLNSWSHLAIVFDGSQVRFYLNGAVSTTKPLAAVLTARSTPLRLGADADTWQFFKGALDDVRLYNRTTTAAEVTADMNTAVGAPPP